MIVDENIEDQTLIRKALASIQVNNRIKICNSAEQALEYLETTSDEPFFILVNTQLPGMSGLELQARIFETEYLRDKDIPFIFFSNTDSPDVVRKAYRMRAQGYFVIPETYIQLKLILFSITDYWQRVVHPSSVIHQPAECYE